MNHYWRTMDDGSPLRQGDIIRTTAFSAPVKWGVVINADCDIAQEKNGQQINYLRIISAKSYAEEFWAPREIQKLIDKRSRTLAEHLNSKLKVAHPNLRPMDAVSLQKWLLSEGAEDVLGKIGLSENLVGAKQKSSMDLLCVLLQHSPETTRIEQLVTAWGIDNRKAEDLLRSLKDELDSNRGFPDYYFIPELPADEQLGYVILLREILAIESKFVFRSQLEAKISGQNECFARTGRFHDRIRYSIAQKLAFLFSRIGLPEEVEATRAIAAELSAEQILKIEGE